MEYLLELLEGGDDRLQSGRRRNKKGVWDTEPAVEYDVDGEDREKTLVIPALPETPERAAHPGRRGSGSGRAPRREAAGGHGGDEPLAAEPAGAVAAGRAGRRTRRRSPSTTRPWTGTRDEDPFADLGPVDPAAAGRRRIRARRRRLRPRVAEGAMPASDDHPTIKNLGTVYEARDDGLRYMRRRRVGTADRNGDPLDGIVNLFDVAIVLAVGFLVAALTAAGVSGLLTSKNMTIVTNPGTPQMQVIVKEGDQITKLDMQTGAQVQGVGTLIGSFYKLADGTVVYVPAGRPAPAGSTPVPGTVADARRHDARRRPPRTTRRTNPYADADAAAHADHRRRPPTPPARRRRP